uniref:Putative ovule protein n=1 Tax=Solanum chacoense TaxID=4108 RepID=A0A0V0GY55_SOLCH
MSNKMNKNPHAYILYLFFFQKFEPKFEILKSNMQLKEFKSHDIYDHMDDPQKITRSSSKSNTNSCTLPKKQYKKLEDKRRKRVASYKSYTIEGKIKNSIRDSLRWIKNKYSSIVHRH